MAANQLLAPPITLGYPAPNCSAQATLGLNAAATWLAMSFVAEQAKTLAKVRLYLNTLTGTPSAAELTCDLYSNGAGIPNASLQSRPADSVPASGNWMQWSGFTTALSVGSVYWLVWKNANASPAANLPTYRHLPAYTLPFGVSGAGIAANPTYGWNKVHTVNSGTAWASQFTPNAAGLRLEYSDATFGGFPVQAVTRPGSGGTGDRAFGKAEVGTRFNLPAGVTFNVKSIWMPAAKFGAPGALRFRLYQGATLLGTTSAIAAADVLGTPGDAYLGWFAAPIPIVSTNQPFRVVMGDATAGDASANGYNGALYTFDSDANSLILKPMNGSVQKTYTTDNTAGPVVWTDTPADFLAFALMLDAGGELTGAAGGLRIPRAMNGGYSG